MNHLRDIGRAAGVLIAAQIAGGMCVNLLWLQPAITGPGGYLANAASHSSAVGMAALVGMLTGAISLAIAVLVWPYFKRYSTALTLWFFALATAGLALAAVESSAVMSLLSYSKAHASAAPADAKTIEALRGIVAAHRNWTHYTHLFVGGAGYAVFYLFLLRFRFIPRVLAAAGLAAVTLQMTAVMLPLFGQPIVMLMLLPMGLCHFLLGIWLMAKGFSVPQTDASYEETSARSAPL